jgi:hypothetical protein
MKLGVNSFPAGSRTPAAGRNTAANPFFEDIMPTRIIREGILTSDRVNQLGTNAELFYRRLMSVVDDFGRFDARPAILRSACYPLKIESVREADISRFLAEVQKAGLIVLYEVEAKGYLEMLDFRQRVRAENSKYPEPPSGKPMSGRCPSDDGHVSDTCPTDDRQMTALVGDVVEGVDEDDRRKTKEKTSCAEPQKDAAPAPAENPEKIVMEFSVAGNKGGKWPLYEKDYQIFVLSYPGVNHEQELRRAWAWCETNPRKRKTPGGMLKFLNWWFSQEQNKSSRGTYGPARAAPPPSLMPQDAVVEFKTWDENEDKEAEAHASVG